MTTILKVDEDLQVAKNLMSFFTAIHGENSFEIRFLPDFGGGYANSLIRHGDYLYEMGKDGKQPYCKFSVEELSKVTIDYYQFALADTYYACGVHFTVNSPNFNEMDKCTAKDEHIINGGVINCQFVDIDAPKEIRKEAVALKAFKYEQAKRIESFALTPSCVVETKHGFHVYWFLQDGKVEFFRHIQIQLIQHFDGDANCINESRTLRMPFFYHMKDPKDKFIVKIRILNPTLRYEQTTLKNTLPELDDITLKKVLKQNNLSKHDEMDSNRRKKILALIEDKIQIRSEKEEDTIRMHCCMGTHPDKNPSAWIDIEYMWYHCSGCGASEPLDLLAEKLNWQDVIDAFNHYELDIDYVLCGIKHKEVSVNDLPQLQMSSYDTYCLEEVYNDVIQHFEGMNQIPNDMHKQYIRDTIQILLNSLQTDKPYLLPLDMGAGKSTIIRLFTQIMLGLRNDFGCIVVVERKEDAKELEKFLNKDKDFTNQIAYAMYGFEKEECKKNQFENRSFQQCTQMAFGIHCPYISDCRYYQQKNEQKKFPVLVMTLKRLDQWFQDLNEYKYFNIEMGKLPRELLIIDEKPFTIKTMDMDLNRFTKYVDYVKAYFGNLEDQSILVEFDYATDQVKRIFNNAKDRQLFEAVIKDFHFSEAFKSVFYTHYNYRQEIYNFPSFLESVLRYGGHTIKDKKNRNKKEKKILIVTSTYKNYADVKGFKTIIFDGTADIDLDYQHMDYNMVCFEPLRTYENLEIYECDYISGSKTTMKKDGMVESLCEQVVEILTENPTSKIFLPVYKVNEKEVKEHLKQYIDKEKIHVAHYGETRGSNKFNECDIVVLGGILHKGEEHYIAKAKAIYEQQHITLSDLKCSVVGKVRRFNDPLIENVKLFDMLVDYSQEIKRTSQRDNTRNVKGKVYVFHKDKQFLAMLGTKFPKCRIVPWSPSVLTDDIIDGKKNNHNQRMFKDLLLRFVREGINEITFKEIQQKMNLTSKQLSKMLSSDNMKNFITSQKFKVETMKGKGSPKKLVKC